MLWTVLSIFVVALLAPGITALSRKAAGWLLPLLPLGIFAYFAQQIPPIRDGMAVRQAYAWVPGFDVSLSFYLDGLSLLFALLVTGIGALIVLYSSGYMAHHPLLGRFYAFLLMFMGSMLGLVLADNMWAFFVFFELTSFSSYLLIGFDHEEESSRVAARKALVVTGAGGLALMAGLILLYLATGTFEFSEVLTRGAAAKASPLYGATLTLVLVGAFTKSAQFPFHFWLPAAMAGPTPVSAYLHSATMVKAGVFLMARLNPVLGGTTAWTVTLVSFGAFTMLLTAWLSLRHTDFKLILAYTTVMVLGLLTMLIGIGSDLAIKAAMVFILVHALYKGALFMVAGNVDHEAGTRQMHKLGGLRRSMPITAAAGIVAALSMGGIPPFFGFIGKEVTYEAVQHLEAGAGWTVLIVTVLANAALIGAALVVAFKPFFGPAHEAADMPKIPHEAPWSMWLGPSLLALLGLTFGVLPALVDMPVVAPAATAVLGETYEVHLALWHGFNTTLAWSLFTIALGVGLFLAWETLHVSTPMRGLDQAFGDGPGRAFEGGLYGVARSAHGVTQVMQSGNLRYYLLTVFFTFGGLVALSFLYGQGLGWPDAHGPVRFYEAVLAIVIAVTALVAAWAPSRFVAILALGVGGYSIAVIYLLFGAPDLAMTQFAIETLTVILLVLVLVNLPRRSYRQHAMPQRLRDAVAALGVGGLLTLVMLAVLSNPFDRYISDYLSNNSYTAAQGHNIVNVILVDFRALDTMGEITVLTVAGLGVYALMRLRKPPE